MCIRDRSWIDSHVRAFEFFGGVPEIIVPDNTRCAVIKPDRYEPDLNLSLIHISSHLMLRHHGQIAQQVEKQHQTYRQLHFLRIALKRKRKANCA